MPWDLPSATGDLIETSLCSMVCNGSKVIESAPDSSRQLNFWWLFGFLQNREKCGMRCLSSWGSRLHVPPSEQEWKTRKIHLYIVNISQHFEWEKARPNRPQLSNISKLERLLTKQKQKTILACVFVAYTSRPRRCYGICAQRWDSHYVMRLEHLWSCPCGLKVFRWSANYDPRA